MHIVSKIVVIFFHCYVWCKSSMSVDVIEKENDKINVINTGCILPWELSSSGFVGNGESMINGKYHKEQWIENSTDYFKW